jgi:hypothetical protein
MTLVARRIAMDSIILTDITTDFPIKTSKRENILYYTYWDLRRELR